MSSIDHIVLDVLLSEKFTERTTTTEHPVEEGADPTDHVRTQPSTLQLEAIITNTPTNLDEQNTRGVVSSGDTGYAGRQYKELQALKFGRAVVVETGARTYKNMQLTELAQSRDSKTGTQSIQFTAQFKEIIIVSTEQVRLTQTKKKTSIPKTPTGKVDQSRKNPEPSKRGSVSAAAVDAISGLFGSRH